MFEKFKQKPVVIILIALAVFVIVVLVAKYSGLKGSNNKPVKNNQSEVKHNPAEDYKLTSVDSKKLPDLMPANIPFETGAVVQQNFQGVNDVTGERQATRVFVSAKTLQENYDSYKNYLEKNGWSLGQTYNAAEIKIISATKDKASLVVSANILNKQNIVNVTYRLAK